MKSSSFVVYKYVEQIFVKINDGGKATQGFVIPNSATKTCILAVVFFTLQSANLLDVKLDILMLFFSVVLVSLRIGTIVSRAEPDPYVHFENFACSLVFGLPSDEQSSDKPSSTKTNKKVFF